jgi:hypothetical protein
MLIRRVRPQCNTCPVKGKVKSPLNIDWALARPLSTRSYPLSSRRKGLGRITGGQVFKTLQGGAPCCSGPGYCWVSWRSGSERVYHDHLQRSVGRIHSCLALIILFLLAWLMVLVWLGLFWALTSLDVATRFFRLPHRSPNGDRCSNAFFPASTSRLRLASK